MSRLDVKREDMIRKRKGLTWRTIISGIWLAISATLAYFFCQYLFASGTLSYLFFYNKLFIPRSVPEWAILAGLIVVIVIIMQFFLIIGFAFSSPAGRTKSGTPSVLSRNPDPLDKKY